MMKGVIIINPYLVPKESVHQAGRLKEEFAKLGVETEIVSDVFLRTQLVEGRLKSEICDIDFAVYLDKDKYQSEIMWSMGVRLFNSHTAIRLCDDKAQTYLALSNSNLNIPKTIFGGLCYSQDLPVKREWAKKIGDCLKYPVIIKESFGSMGKGVYLAKDEDELLAVIEKIKLKPYIFQEYLGKKKGVDIRVIVIGGKAICAMERKNENDFRSNVAQGGSGTAIELSPKFKAAAEKCAKLLHLDYCGVDLLFGDDDKPYVCEVNSNAFLGGIEAATGLNVAKAYAEYIIETVKKNK